MVLDRSVRIRLAYMLATTRSPAVVVGFLEAIEALWAKEPAAAEAIVMTAPKGQRFIINGVEVIAA